MEAIIASLTRDKDNLIQAIWEAWDNPSISNSQMAKWDYEIELINRLLWALTTD